ncbi:MAG: 3-methyl-2-oxobutanoate hydroxymethyltransferase [Heliobacteriaceae bacterium]|jgi:3-methyl-2-oxobutanoate hydroxymethyltransferase|nr:3-methyl-2-oxobutanoate hydroxymethyltransferase [Heliobacteriaceae bacterium]
MLKKVTLNTIQKMKESGEKISMLTAYDYSTAKYIDEAGIDMVLVGDSLAMTALGYDTTCALGMEEMVIFTRAVAKGAKRALVTADMPFMSYQADLAQAVQNAGALMKAGAGAVKLEGASEHILQVVQRCVQSGVPVVGHLGFTPQSVNTLGGYTVQGKSFEAAQLILEQAQALEKAGAFAIVLEMVPEESAEYITKNLRIPTISCGAGRHCSGQVIVCDDMFGKYSEFKPKFARRYGDMRAFILDCASRYNSDVKNGDFPGDEEVFRLEEKELNNIR